ncbi:MAG: energy transducer TonB [Acidobacteriia bacterium]|nr:energy transducer TonB [Terriglobia bacterium]
MDYFYIVFHDYSPLWSDYILDVRAKKGDVIIRNIKVGALDVKAVEATMKDMTPLKLVGDLNPCFFPADYEHNQSAVLDLSRISIVASCSGKERIHLLPSRDRVDLDRLKKEAPGLAALYDLSNLVQKAAFGEAPIFFNISEKQNGELRRFGESLVPDLLSGKYDMAFLRYCGRKERSNEPFCDPHSARTKLLILNQTDINAPQGSVKLMDAENFHFINYVVPEYPRLAQRARVEQYVSLELWIDPATGKPAKAVVLKGHPMLDESAVNAALQWQFDLSSQKVDQPIRLTLGYLLERWQKR